nr:MAG TPA: Heterokaryon incompatibility protein (HET) [Caudoviricetes sp.]
MSPVPGVVSDLILFPPCNLELAKAPDAKKCISVEILGPNITGYILVDQSCINQGDNRALYISKYGEGYSHNSVHSPNNANRISLDISRSNSIYSNAITTVQPKSINLNYIIKV